jgi:hypothetical protein
MTTGIALFLLAVLLVCGCSREPITGPDKQSVILPLAIGNQWISRVSNFSSTAIGVVTSTWMDTVTVTGEETIDNERWFIIDSMVSRTNRSDGMWVKLRGFDSWLVAKYPAAVGDTFSTRVTPDPFANDTTIIYLSVVSTSTSVTVPAGTFQCMEYKTNIAVRGSVLLEAQEDHYYFAPGIGMVKSETVLVAPGGSMTIPVRRWELVEYKVK